MIGQQAVGVYVEMELGLGKRDVFQKLLVVAVIEEYLLAIIAAGSDMVKTMLGLQSVGSSHEMILSNKTDLSKQFTFQGLTPSFSLRNRPRSLEPVALALASNPVPLAFKLAPKVKSRAEIKGWLTGFEPATTRSTILRSSQAELQPP